VVFGIAHGFTVKSSFNKHVGTDGAAVVFGDAVRIGIRKEGDAVRIGRVWGWGWGLGGFGPSWTKPPVTP
jgi:hypothetical protein